MHQIHFRWFANRVAAFPRGHRTTVCFGRRAINFISDASCTNRKLDKSQVPLQIDNGNRSYSTSGSFLLASGAKRLLPTVVTGIPADRDMVIILTQGGNVWNWHGFLVRRFRTPTQSMVQQTPSVGNGNLRRWLRTRRRPFLPLH